MGSAPSTAPSTAPAVHAPTPSSVLAPTQTPLTGLTPAPALPAPRSVASARVTTPAPVPRVADPAPVPRVADPAPRGQLTARPQPPVLTNPTQRPSTGPVQAQARPRPPSSSGATRAQLHPQPLPRPQPAMGRTSDPSIQPALTQPVPRAAQGPAPPARLLSGPAAGMMPVNTRVQPQHMPHPSFVPPSTAPSLPNPRTSGASFPTRNPPPLPPPSTRPQRPRMGREPTASLPKQDQRYQPIQHHTQQSGMDWEEMDGGASVNAVNTINTFDNASYGNGDGDDYDMNFHEDTSVAQSTNEQQYAPSVYQQHDHQQLYQLPEEQYHEPLPPPPRRKTPHPAMAQLQQQRTTEHAAASMQRHGGPPQMQRRGGPPSMHRGGPSSMQHGGPSSMQRGSSSLMPNYAWPQDVGDQWAAEELQELNDDPEADLQDDVHMG